MAKTIKQMVKQAVKEGQAASKKTAVEAPDAVIPNTNSSGKVTPNVKDTQRQVSSAKKSTPVISGSLFSMRSFNADRDLPIVYSDKYNMSMAGIELLHHFDTKKYLKIAEHLSDEFLDTPWARPRHFDEPLEENQEEEDHTRPRKLRYLKPSRPVNRSELEIHHSMDYLNAIHEEKSLIARITETWVLNLVPKCAIESRLLTPIKWQVAGTIFAAYLAMQHGWSINLGGGFHQASASNGETFCLFSDICLAMKYVWRKHPLQKFMIIDLDAHQATGLERDILEFEIKRRKMVFMLDVFNTSIQPPDSHAEQAINLKVELARFTGDDTYISRLDDALKQAFEKFKPTMVIYVAGQDVLKNDQLGLMNLSDEGLKKRDELVFTWAVEKHKCPIMMLLGGGYLTRGAKIQADSIRNLFAKGLIWGGHRSGSRTLSRPRPNQPHRNSQSHSKEAVKHITTVKKSIESAEKNSASPQVLAPNSVSKTTTARQEQSRKTQVIPTAPVSLRFRVAAKKQPDESSASKKS